MIKRFLVIAILFCIAYGDEVSKKYVQYLQNLSVKTKKYRFFKLILPPVQKIDTKLRRLYLQTLQDIQNGTHKERIAQLKRSYQAKDDLELLKRIKPHPISITLAQAAIESAWATSRFFVEANNVFGVWSRSSDPTKTIASDEVRKSGKQVHLRKYPSIEASIEHYYKNIATNKAYRCFREVRYFSDNPYEIVTLLHKYSEKGSLYPIELAKIIKHNNLTRYDSPISLPKLQMDDYFENNETNVSLK